MTDKMMLPPSEVEEMLAEEQRIQQRVRDISDATTPSVETLGDLWRRARAKLKDPRVGDQEAALWSELMTALDRLVAHECRKTGANAVNVLFDPLNEEPWCL